MLHENVGPIEADSEQAIFRELGLSKYIPPALREGLAEVEAAETDSSPKLVELMIYAVVSTIIQPPRMA